MKARVSILLSACLVIMAVQARALAAPAIFGGALYSLTSKAEDWNAAEAEAVADGGHLASIHDAEQEQFIVDTFLNGAARPNVLWIGLHDPVQGDGDGTQHAADFVWTDGTAVDYTDWNTVTGEPNNYNGIEYWTAINWHNAATGQGTPGLWNDMAVGGTDSYSVAANGPYYGIIEVPGPGAITLLAVGLGMGGWARRSRQDRRSSLSFRRPARRKACRILR